MFMILAMENYSRGAQTKKETPERWSRSVCWTHMNSSLIQTEELWAKHALAVKYSPYPCMVLGWTTENWCCCALIYTHSTYIPCKWGLVTIRYTKNRKKYKHAELCVKKLGNTRTIVTCNSNLVLYRNILWFGLWLYGFSIHFLPQYLPNLGCGYVC